MAVQNARAEVLDDHVGAQRKPLEQIAAGGILQIDADAALVAVQSPEIETADLERDLARITDAVAAPRLLDLDDVCAHVAEQGRAPRARGLVTEVEDFDAGQWLAAVVHGPTYRDFPSSASVRADGLASSPSIQRAMQKESKATRKKAAPTNKTAARKRAPDPVKDAPVKRKTEAATSSRRVIFIDVENTSSEAALIGALDQLDIDRTAIPTELVAVGNWRVIGQHVARMLAQRGARLMHTAPATGVKDWSDLSIAVAAGIWLGRAQPGDQIEIVSADRAFDAIADSAVNLGVKFRRLTYGPLSGLAESITAAEPAAGVQRRGRRGGRHRRRGVAPPPPWAPPPPSPALPVKPTATSASASTNGAEKDIQGATPEQIIATIARLTARAPERGVNLDLLINALKAEGFGRPAGSPRLVTRLRKMKDVEVSPTGMVRLVSLPPGPLPIELSAERAPEPTAAAPAAKAASGKRPRRRGGRGRRRPKSAAGTAGEPSNEASP